MSISSAAAEAGENAGKGLGTLVGKMPGDVFVDLFTGRNPLRNIVDNTRTGLGNILWTPLEFAGKAMMRTVGGTAKSMGKALLHTPLPFGGSS